MNRRSSFASTAHVFGEMTSHVDVRMDRFFGFLLFACCVLNVFAGAYSFDDLEADMRAAYFGDTARVQEIVRSAQNWKPAPFAGDKPNLGMFLGYALANGKRETARAILDSGWPTSEDQLAALFDSPWITRKEFVFLTEAIPERVRQFGGACLTRAASGGRVEAVEVLLNTGLPLGDHHRRVLLAAIGSGNPHLVDLLLAAGADPYHGEKPKRVVDDVARIRSYSLLKKLDPKGEYGELMKALEASMPPADSKFPGYWSYSPSGGGLGSIAVALQPDGTGMMGTDSQTSLVVWKQLSETMISVEPTPTSPARVLSAGPAAAAVGLKLELTPDGTLGPADDKETLRLRRVVESPSPKPDRRFPLFVRLEKAWVTPEEDLIIQVNGMCGLASISRLVEGAELTHHHDKPTDPNVLRWETFRRPQEFPLPAGSIEIAISEQAESPVHSYRWERFAYEPDRPAQLEPGESHRIFPLITQESFRPDGRAEYADFVSGWALKRKAKFRHDRDWVVFFVLKSTENTYAGDNP
jgi:hypothetical protein